MDKFLFEQPELRVESFSAKEDVLFVSSLTLGEDETNFVKILPAIGNGNVYN